MQKRILITLISFLSLSFAITSCNNNTGNSGTTADSTTAATATVTPAPAPANDSETSDSAEIKGHLESAEKMLSPQDAKFALVKNLAETQQGIIRAGNDSCSNNPSGSPKDCSVNFCGDADCTRKILCTHRINKAIFDQLTDNETYGNASFTAAKVHKVIDGADCQTSAVKFSTLLGFYRMRCVSNTTVSTTGSSRRSFYSLALLQGIMADSKVDHIVLYGGLTSTTSAKQYKIIPFQVYYTGGKIEYYDVSDTQP